MNLHFDATNVDTTSQFEALPAGDYPVMIIGSQMKATKDGRGEYLELTLEVQDGQHRGAKLWDRLNLHNHNPKAVEIAQRALAQICHAVGVMQLQGTAEPLHYKPLVASVRAKPDEQRGMVNEVRGYKRLDAGAGQSRSAAPTVPRAAAPTAAMPTVSAPRAAAPAMPWAIAKA